MKGLILLILGTDHITEVTGQATAEDMPLTRAPSQLRLAIGRIIRMAPGITSAGPITCGGRDTGHGATVEASGSAGTTW